MNEFNHLHKYYKKKIRKRKKRKKTDFALTDGNTAKHQTIINIMEKKQTKTLYIKKNKYKENTNKQTKISPSPSQHAFHNALLSQLIKHYLKCSVLYCMLLFYSATRLIRFSLSFIFIELANGMSILSVCLFISK